MYGACHPLIDGVLTGAIECDANRASSGIDVFALKRGLSPTNLHSPFRGGAIRALFDPGITQAQFKLVPFTQTLPADYTPFLPFTDGGLAVYLGAFELLRVDSIDVVEALQGNLDAWDGTQFDIPIEFKTKGTVLLSGKIFTDNAQAIINGSGPYAYIGPTVLVTGNSFSGVLDPGLPNWLVEDLDEDLSELFFALETGFGRELKQKASILFAFRGYETDGFSNTGGE